MRAAIDIGSNTVQMLAGEVSGGNVLPCLHFLATTRLGEGCQDGLLKEERIKQTVDALCRINEILDDADIHNVCLVGTSAIRDAANSEILLKAVEDACGWKINILSGKEEARLSYIGATSLLKNKGTSPLVIDIGGGSTEIIWQNESGVLVASSANVGALRATLGSWDESRIKAELQSQLILPHQSKAIIGVGGTVTTAAALLYGLSKYSREAVHGRQLDRDMLFSLRQKLAVLLPEERCTYSSLLVQRGEIIVQGLDILLAVLDILHSDSLFASDAGILDGVLLAWEK